MGDKYIPRKDGIIRFLKWYFGLSLAIGIGGAVIITSVMPQDAVVKNVIVPICKEAPAVCEKLFPT